MVDEYQNEDVRELLYGSYRIIYRIHATRIDVVAIVHAAMLLPPEPP